MFGDEMLLTERLDIFQPDKTICQKFQDVCKPTACLGDLENGQICQCPDLYGGLFCNKLARTPCEKWKAFYEDVQSIQSVNPALNITNEQKSILMNFKVSLNHTVCSMDVCDVRAVILLMKLFITQINIHWHFSNCGGPSSMGGAMSCWGEGG
uniref:EGF-like domain-containing protein n=1 Tax=Biomphalaria glabrata TaxID=6526 RepID=A0A2C9M2K0_BIOGL